MNKNITAFFVVNKNNVTVAFESNLSDFVEMFQKIEPTARNYMFYYRQFKKSKSFTIGKYHFQQLV